MHGDASTPTGPVDRPVMMSQVLIGLLMLAGSVGVVAWQWKWVKSVFDGPANITADRLAALSDLNELGNQWVTVTADKVVETGLQKVSGRSGAVRSRFVIARVKDRYLVAEVPAAATGNRLKGYLGVWSHAHGLQAVGTAAGQVPEGKLLPFQMDAERDQTTQVYCLLGTMAFFCVGGLWAINLGLSGGGGPTRSPLEDGRVDDAFVPLSTSKYRPR
jgi:hypothetical protein